MGGSAYWNGFFGHNHTARKHFYGKIGVVFGYFFDNGAKPIAPAAISVVAIK
jgi:hypothetical protein